MGTKLIEEARKLGIKLTVRAHQDSHFNTKLIEKNAPYEEFVNINDVEPYNVPKTAKTVCYGYTHLIKLQDNGNININNIDADIFIPVITISTNTDYGRNLVRDSFTILKFKEEFDPETQGCVDENSEDEIKIQENIKKLFSSKTLPTASSTTKHDDLDTLDLTSGDLTSEKSSKTPSKLKSTAKEFVPPTRAVLPPPIPQSPHKLSASATPFRPRSTTYLSTDKFKSKYLKYKSKYLKLKSKLNR